MRLDAPPERAYSSEEAAVLLGVSVERVRQRVRATTDPLGGHRSGRILLVDADRVDAEVAAEAARRRTLEGAAPPPPRTGPNLEALSSADVHVALANARVDELERELLRRQVAELEGRLAAAEEMIGELLSTLQSLSASLFGRRAGS